MSIHRPDRFADERPPSRRFERDDSPLDPPHRAGESPSRGPESPNAGAHDALVKGSADPLDRARVRWFLEFARAELAPLRAEAIRAEDFLGRYEDLHVILERGSLALVPEGDAEAILRPFGETDVFYLPAVPEIRVRFLRDASGEVTALRVFSWEGAPREHHRRRS